MDAEPLSVPAKILHRNGEPGIPLGRQPLLPFFQQSHMCLTGRDDTRGTKGFEDGIDFLFQDTHRLGTA